MIAHVPGPLYAGLMLQLTPPPAGNGSFSVTAVAVPVPAALLFRTTTVYPIDAPEETVAASAVFVTLKLGHCTVIVALDCTVLLFVAVAVAVLEYAEQLAVLVPLVT